MTLFVQLPVGRRREERFQRCQSSGRDYKAGA